MLNYGVATNKEICISWVCLCVDSCNVMGDAGGESDDVFVLGSLITSLFLLGQC